jgi:hypothetical protein
MREIVAWAVPLLVSLFLIHTAADILYLRAVSLQVTGGDDRATRRDTNRGPVHEVDSDVTAGGIIT